MDVADKFFTYLKSNYQSPYSIKSYYDDVVKFLEYSKTYEVSEDIINRYVVLLSKLGKSSTTIKRKLSSLSIFFYFLRKSGIYDFDFEKIPRPKTQKNLPKFLDIDETLRLLESIKHTRDKAILSLLYSGGLRVSELTKLDIQDINFQNSTIIVKRKGGKQMLLPISQSTLKYIKDYIKNRTKEPVFLNKFNSRLSDRSVETIVKKYAKNTLLKDISPHTLRHSRATHLLNNGMDLRILQRFLGHSSILATQVYTHLSLKDVTAAYDNFHPLNKKD